MELELAMENLMDQLEAAGKLDDTVKMCIRDSPESYRTIFSPCVHSKEWEYNPE